MKKYQNRKMKGTCYCKITKTDVQESETAAVHMDEPKHQDRKRKQNDRTKVRVR